MIIKMRNDRRTMRRDEIRLTETRRRTERTTDQPPTTRTISDQESNRNWKRNEEMLLFPFLQTSRLLFHHGRRVVQCSYLIQYLKMQVKHETLDIHGFLGDVPFPLHVSYFFFGLGHGDSNNQYDFEENINFAVHPSLQGGSHKNRIAAFAIALKQVATPKDKAYMQQVNENVLALASALLRRKCKLVTGGTDNHLLMWDLTT
ncbi:serine hydroxymethyltransferase-like isoform X2 [Mangifera indica]|uniref:serine hydroxymethyltransferase-like isoform X2 n=1 Tax=Mangifera indica TaxID=29780 RepID=UPI001CFAB8F1|nr:serine hydroxymethyltransferase-like isoform X2 [Mangifera indica]